METRVDAAVFPNRRQAGFTMAVLFLVAALCTIDRFILNLMVDPIRADLQISETQMSLLQGLAFSLFYSLAGLPLGALADRRSRSNLLMAGVAVWSGATAMAAFADSYSVMFAARILVGAGEATMWPVAVSMIADLFAPRHRGKAISGIILGQIFGSSTALFGGGLLLKAAGEGLFANVPLLGSLVPWRAVLMICAGTGGVLLLVLALVREPRRLHPPAARDGIGLMPLLRYARDRDPAILLILAASFLLSLAIYASAAWTAPFYIRHFRMTPGQLGPILGAIGLAAGIAGTLLAGLLADRAERLSRRSAKASLAMLAIVGCMPAALIAASPGLGVALGATALASICGPVSGAMMIILLQDRAPPDMRGFAMAVNTLVGGLFGASAGPFLTALATDHVFGDPALVGWSLALVIFPALLAALLIVGLLRRQLLRAQGLEPAIAPIAPSIEQASTATR